jgi:hypothetical protein
MLDGRTISGVTESAEDRAGAPLASRLDWGERYARFLLTRSPLGSVVRWVAGIRASVHAKLLCGFLLVTLLFIAMGAVSLATIAKMSRQSQLLDQAHERVHWSLQANTPFRWS